MATKKVKVDEDVTVDPELEQALQLNAESNGESNGDTPKQSKRGKHLRTRFDTDDYKKDSDTVHRFFHDLLTSIGLENDFEQFAANYNGWLQGHKEFLEKEARLKQIAEELGLSVVVTK